VQVDAEEHGIGEDQRQAAAEEHRAKAEPELRRDPEGEQPADAPGGLRHVVHPAELLRIGKALREAKREAEREDEQHGKESASSLLLNCRIAQPKSAPGFPT
jgi:hypothetical protein